MSRTYLTTHQVARMVGASPSTVLSWVDRGWLPAHRTPGGHRRIDKQALVEFLRAHDMPELVSEEEPVRLLVAMKSNGEGKQLAERLRALRPELRVDAADGVIEALAHLFDTPPDFLLLDATLAGIDVQVLCQELSRFAASARVRIVVVRPQSMSTLDPGLREAGVFSVGDASASPETIAECLSLDNTGLIRPKAS